MPSTYKAPEYPYVKPAELDGVARTRVAIVGAGPIGLAAAIDLALQGIRTNTLRALLSRKLAVSFLLSI